jgi:hypothetical protein
VQAETQLRVVVPIEEEEEEEEEDYLINGTIFEKNFEHKMCVLIFSTSFV